VTHMHCHDIEVRVDYLDVVVVVAAAVVVDDFVVVVDVEYVDRDWLDASMDEHFDDADDVDDVKLLVVEEQMAVELLVVAMMEYSSFRMN
jgi:hypothetical protein